MRKRICFQSYTEKKLKNCDILTKLTCGFAGVVDCRKMANKSMLTEKKKTIGKSSHIWIQNLKKYFGLFYITI
jgi:hypothetical protein